MTRKDWMTALSKEDLAFRLFGKEIWNRSCEQCVFYKVDKFGKWKCTNLEQEDRCYEEFQDWLEEEMG